MENRQINRLEMYVRVRGVFTAQPALWNALPALARQIRALDGVLDSVAALREFEEADRNGLAIDPVPMSEILVDAILSIAGPMTAYAADQSDERLPANILFKPTERFDWRRAELQARPRFAAEPSRPLDEPFLDPLALEALKAMIDAYTTVAGAPRDEAARSKTLAQVIGDQLAVAERILTERVDRLMDQFRSSETKFFANYQNARRIPARPGSVRSELPPETPATLRPATTHFSAAARG